MMEKRSGLGFIFIFIGLFLVLSSAMLALREYFFYRVFFEKTASITIVLSTLANELLILIVKIAFLGIMIAAGSILLRYGIEMIK